MAEEILSINPDTKCTNPGTNTIKCLHSRFSDHYQYPGDIFIKIDLKKIKSPEYYMHSNVYSRSRQNISQRDSRSRGCEVFTKNKHVELMNE